MLLHLASNSVLFIQVKKAKAHKKKKQNFVQTQKTMRISSTTK